MNHGHWIIFFFKKYLKLPTWQRDSFYYSLDRLHGPTASLLLFDLRSCREYSWWPLPGLHLLMPRRMSGDRGALHQEELLLRLRQRQIPQEEMQAGSGQEASQLKKQVMEGLTWRLWVHFSFTRIDCLFSGTTRTSVACTALVVGLTPTPKTLLRTAWFSASCARTGSTEDISWSTQQAPFQVRSLGWTLDILLQGIKKELGSDNFFIDARLS